MINKENKATGEWRPASGDDMNVQTKRKLYSVDVRAEKHFDQMNPAGLVLNKPHLCTRRRGEGGVQPIRKHRSK